MIEFLLHAVGCFFWCGVWHYAHHLWHARSKPTHYDKPVGPKYGTHVNTDWRTRLFMNGGMRL